MMCDIDISYWNKTWGRRKVRGRPRRCPVISLLRRLTRLSNRLLLRSESGNSTSRSPLRTLWSVPPTACSIPKPNRCDLTRYKRGGVQKYRVSYKKSSYNDISHTRIRIEDSKTVVIKTKQINCLDASVGYYEQLGRLTWV